MRRLCTLVVVVALIMVLCAARPQPHEAYKDYGHDVCNWLDGTDENDENARPIRELMTEGHILCMRDDVAARARFVEAVTLFRSSPRALPHHYLDSALRHIRRIDVVSARQCRRQTRPLRRCCRVPREARRGRARTPGVVDVEGGVVRAPLRPRCVAGCGRPRGEVVCEGAEALQARGVVRGVSVLP